MARRPAFWLVFALVSLLAVVAARQHFRRAFPIVSIDLRMDRAEALRRAREVAARHHLGPQGFRQAATFGGDEEVQTYVELEAGGQEAFARMIREGPYIPYTWQVRHFREHDANETWIRFTPAGVAYGFVERLPETAPGPQLPRPEARAIAERGARAWHVPLAEYALVEHAQEEKPGGRVDHTLVYERPDRIGEGRYRVRLVVGGDRLVEVTPFVRVPEAFERRYQQLRSANEAIGFGSGIAVLVLYGLGGIVLGLFLLLRHRWVVWRPALAWGAVVAALQVLAMVNEWPLAWLRYDTALSTGAFLAQQVTALAAGAVSMTVLFTLSFMAAESLSRRAFPDHPQLWRAWSREAGASREVLGHTVGGYLLVPLFFAYEVALYFVASRWLGWWTPSDALVHPDVLATYVPWLSAIAPSVQAGFWEECLFRAVPLAAAAIIGDRFGRRRAFLAVAMVVQALVFGAGHAPYPNQPAYARPVELILPSLLFGAVYLRYGLLPGIVLHIAFDTVWFALPLFVSRTPGILVDRTLVVVAALVPLGVVLWRRWQAGRWLTLASPLRNGGWRPEPRLEPQAQAAPARFAGEPSRRLGARVLAAGLVGVAAWAAVSIALREDVPVIRVSRDTAVANATAAVREAGGHIAPTWRTFATVAADPDEAHRFVRDTAGAATWRQLVGTWLPAPRWRVRLARFEGDLAARAEEWGVAVAGDGAVSRVRHVLPEAAPGETLVEDEARDLARRTVGTRFALGPAHLRELSVVPSTLPARTDWIVTFEDRSRPPLPQGELRVSVAIAGREVTDAWRFVHVPEQWERDQHDRRTIASVVNVAGSALLGALVLGFAATTLVGWSRGRSAWSGPLRMFLLLAGVRGLDLANSWPARVAGFSTAQPFALQATQVAVALALGATLVPAIVALAAAGTRLRSSHAFSRRQVVRLGLGVGGVACGVGALTSMIRGGSDAMWPSFAGADTVLPAAALPLGAVFAFVVRTVILGLVFAAADRSSDGWTRHRARTAVIVVGIGALVAGGAPEPALLRWAAGGVLVGLLLLAAYVLVFRWDLSPLPLAVGLVTAVSSLQDGLARPYPGALIGGVVAALAVMGLSATRLAPGSTLVPADGAAGTMAATPSSRRE